MDRLKIELLISCTWIFLHEKIYIWDWIWYFLTTSWRKNAFPGNVSISGPSSGVEYIYSVRLLPSRSSARCFFWSFSFAVDSSAMLTMEERSYMLMRESWWRSFSFLMPAVASSLEWLFFNLCSLSHIKHTCTPRIHDVLELRQYGLLPWRHPRSAGASSVKHFHAILVGCSRSPPNVFPR